VKDASQDVEEDVTQDMAEGVLGAAEAGGVKVLILSIAIFHRRNPRIIISSRQALFERPKAVVGAAGPGAVAGEGEEAHDHSPEKFSARVGVGEGAVTCRSTARRRGDVFLGACRRGRRRGGMQLYQLRAAWGATGQLSGIWLGLWLWESASGGAAKSASYDD